MLDPYKHVAQPDAPDGVCREMLLHACSLEGHLQRCSLCTHHIFELYLDFDAVMSVMSVALDV